LPRPPPPADSFQLDYGQEDILDVGIKPLNILPVDKSPPLTIKLVSTAADTNREEGEISEEEEPPPPAEATTSAKKLSRSPEPDQEYVRLNKPRSSSSLPTAAPVPHFLLPEVQSPPVFTDKLLDPPPTMPTLCLEEQPSENLMDHVPANAETPPSFYRLGPENVRPGLSGTSSYYMP
jgi:hypothetical protein